MTELFFIFRPDKYGLQCDSVHTSYFDAMHYFDNGDVMAVAYAGDAINEIPVKNIVKIGVSFLNVYGDKLAKDEDGYLVSAANGIIFGG